MGSRLFSNTTNLLGGHDFLNAEHREKIAGLLGIDAARIPQRNSLAYDQIVQGIADGTIKGLWIIATNTAHSWINQKSFRDVAPKLDFLVVQDMYSTTDTAQLADLVLPAAGWGEKEGTLINSERRYGLVKKVARAPGQALSDFNIFKLIAQYWGCGPTFAAWSSPEAVFQLLKEISRGQPCDVTGIADYRAIDERGGIQWPWTENDESQRNSLTADESSFRERRLFEEGQFFHADRRAQFCFEEPRSPPETIDAEFPFVLLTGRGSSSQWHTQTRTAKSDVLRKLSPAEVYVEINPLDAEGLGITPNTPVKIRSRRAEIVATAFITPTVQAGQIFLPMHYGVVNQLTNSTFDPYSRQPSYKWTCVAIEPVPIGMR
jgi:assimilatory nitrate reductase catalytic subunit